MSIQGNKVLSQKNVLLHGNNSYSENVMYIFMVNQCALALERFPCQYLNLKVLNNQFFFQQIKLNQLDLFYWNTVT